MKRIYATRRSSQRVEARSIHSGREAKRPSCSAPLPVMLLQQLVTFLLRQDSRCVSCSPPAPRMAPNVGHRSQQLRLMHLGLTLGRASFLTCSQLSTTRPLQPTAPLAKVGNRITDRLGTQPSGHCILRVCRLDTTRTLSWPSRNSILVSSQSL